MEQEISALADMRPVATVPYDVTEPCFSFQGRGGV
jgi:hypothetical protein